MEFYGKFADRFHDLLKVNEPCSQQGKGLIITFDRKCFEEYDAVILTMLYLKVLHDMVSQNS